MTDIPSPETIANLKWQADDILARQRAIVQARQYYDGDHPVFLTDRMKEFIGLGAKDAVPFKMNLYKTVIKAVVERLKVTGFDSDEQEQTLLDGSTVKPLAAWAWERWQQERMDAGMTEVHKGAVKEGEYFVIVAPDEALKRACFYPHPAYTSAEAGGDEYGIKVFYSSEDDRKREIAYATKHWIEEVPYQDGTRLRKRREKRMTVYWPDRIERYIWEKGEWTEYAPVQAWVDTDKRPLGVPIVPFCNQDRRGRADDAMGLQDALNKALVDLVAAGDLSAFQLLVAFGFYPTTDGQPPEEDGSNMLKIGPGQVVGTTKSKNDADIKAIPPADLNQLINLADKLVQWMAMVTDTPIARFLVTKQIASQETQKEGEGPLVSEAEYLQVIFGDAWEDCLTLAARIENTFFAAGLPIEAVTLQTQWAPAATRDQTAEMAAAEARGRLGVPQRKLWAELGYSQTEIADMQAMKEEDDQASLERQQALFEARPAPAFGRN